MHLIIVLRRSVRSQRRTLISGADVLRCIEQPDVRCAGSERLQLRVDVADVAPDGHWGGVTDQKRKTQRLLTAEAIEVVHLWDFGEQDDKFSLLCQPPYAVEKGRQKRRRDLLVRSP